MNGQSKRSTSDCPVTRESVRAEATAAFDELVRFCETCPTAFWMFEKELLVRIAVLGVCLIRLFLTARYERLDLQPFLEDGKYRRGDNYAERTLKTYYGVVTYGRHYLLSPRLRLQGARRLCKAAVNSAPAHETIEQVVLGMGRDAAPFMHQFKYGDH